MKHYGITPQPQDEKTFLSLCAHFRQSGIPLTSRRDRALLLSANLADDQVAALRDQGHKVYAEAQFDHCSHV